MDSTADPTGAAATQSRETAALDSLKERVQWLNSMGVVECMAGVLLLSGLASSSVGAVVGGAVVVGCPIPLMPGNSERFAKRSLGIYLVVVALAVASLHVHRQGLTSVGELAGVVGLFLGPCALLGGLIWSRMLPAARRSLEETPVDARLQIKVSRGYGGMPQTTAMLWPSGSASTTALARFGSQWSLLETRR